MTDSLKVLSPNALRKGADYERTYHHVSVEHDPDMTIEDVLKPGFWKHHANKLKKADVIDVLGPGFDMTVRVKSTGLGFANVYPLRVLKDENFAKKQAAGEDLKAPDGYVVDHHWKTNWRVRTTPEGVEISRNHETKADAIASAQEHFDKTHGVAA
jgi:hypothetical protein